MGIIEPQFYQIVFFSCLGTEKFFFLNQNQHFCQEVIKYIFFQNPQVLNKNPGKIYDREILKHP